MALVKGDFFRLMGVPAEQGRLPEGGETDWVAICLAPGGEVSGDRRCSVVGYGWRKPAYVVSALVPDRFTFPSDDVVSVPGFRRRRGRRSGSATGRTRGRSS